MITVRIGKSRYKIKNKWSELTLGECIAITGITIPDKLVEYYIGDGGNEVHLEITTEDIHKRWPEYFGRVLYLLSDIPYEVIDYIPPDERTAIWNTYIRDFVVSLWVGVPLVDKDCAVLSESFEFKGKRYYLPHSAKVLGRKIPFHDTNVTRFAEIADLYVATTKFRDGGWEHMPLLMAVSTRLEGEDYDEATAIERAKEFRDLPMPVVWGFFASWGALLTASLNYSLGYIRKALRRARWAARWNLFTSLPALVWKRLVKLWK